MKPFGVSYLLDMYKCRPGAADDLELNYRFLEQLVDVIGMTKQCNPLVFHGPTAKGIELYRERHSDSHHRAEAIHLVGHLHMRCH